MSRKKGENVSIVPPLNFPQGKWKAGRTPRVSKGKVGNLHRASIGEVCFTDTFETTDTTYRYGQVVVEYCAIPLVTRSVSVLLGTGTGYYYTYTVLVFTQNPIVVEDRYCAYL